MFRVLPAAVSLLLCAATVRSDEKPNAASAAATKQYNALVDEFDNAGGAREFAGRFIDLAEQHSKTAVAEDSLIWVVVNVSRGKDLEKAITLLARNHRTSSKLAPICSNLAQRPSRASENLLRELRKKSPHKDVRAQASMFLAVYLQRQLGLIDALKETTDRRRFSQFYGKAFTDHLAELNTAASVSEIEAIYEDVRESFPDVEFEDSTMGETARLQLYAIRNLSLGRTAPETTGIDVDGKSFKLSDYRGKVVLLDFWGHW